MNIINAIISLVNNPVTKLVSVYESQNRANSAADALEEYVKDLFADSFGLEQSERIQKHNQVFSYLGNSNNPPNIMLKNGDAIEVKNIKSYNCALSLNSSYPKHKLNANHAMVSAACRAAEDWTEKDIIYTVGVVNKGNLIYLCMVYGENYFPHEQFYQLPLDPLGISTIKHAVLDFKNPIQNFDYIYRPDIKKRF